VSFSGQKEDVSCESERSARAFDPADGAWHSLPDMPSARSSHDSAIIDSHLYVVGGWTLDTNEDRRRWAEDLFVLDLREPDSGWSEVSAPFRRRAIASVALAGQLVVLGGMDADGEMSNRVDLYDPATGRWSRGPEFPSTAFGAAAEVVGDQVFASASDGKVYSWRVGDEAWRAAGVLTFPRFFHQMARTADGEELLFIGGMSRGVRPRHVERLSLTTSRAAGNAIRHWTIPSPSPAKNRQALFIEDGWLYAFGGNNSTGQHDFEPENFLADGYRLSLADLRWRKIEPLPRARQSMRTVLSPDGARRIAVGGFAHDGEVARTFADGFSFDLESRTWSELGTVLPEPRSQYGIAEHDGSYWIFGGLDYDPRRSAEDRFDHVRDVLIADADAGAESLNFEPAGVGLPRPRRAFGGAALDGKYYLIGGMKDDFQIVEPCEAFDFETRRFEFHPRPDSAASFAGTRRSRRTPLSRRGIVSQKRRRRTGTESVDRGVRSRDRPMDHAAR